MSGISYTPPLENLPIFDSAMFLATQQALTLNNLSNLFAQYPTVQGTLNIPSVVVPGTSTLGVVNTGILTATNTAGGRQLQIKDSVNAGASYIMNNGNQLSINSVTDTSIPVSLFQTALLLQTRDPANGGVVLLNGNSTSMTIGNAATLNLSGGTTMNVTYPTLNTQSITLAVNQTLNMSGTGSIVQSTPSNVSNLLGNTSISGIAGTKQLSFRSANNGVYSALWQNLNDNYLTCLSNNSGGSTLHIQASDITNTTIDLVSISPTLFSVAHTTDISLNSTNPPTTTATQPIASDSTTKIPTTAWVQSAISIGNVASATSVSVISDNTAGTYYIPFAKTTALLSSNQQLYIDDTTGPLIYNASTGGLSCASVSLTTGLALPTTALTSTFSTGVLSVSGGSLSQRNSTITFTGVVAQFIITLTMLGPLTNGIYYVTILNSITGGTLTVNTGLGTNIKTKYSAAVVIPAGATALMTINVLLVGAVVTTIVDCYSLT